MGLVVALGQNISQDYWGDIAPSVRLYPTGLWDALPGGGKRVGFKATFEDLGLPDVAKPFTTDCSTWLYFELDADGRAVALENAALRNRLVRVS
ncbi:hypothetical protein NUW58_g10718 [Xylaria curta]|uniref:Uncharacterized protein n=1 Tax=Xylaria curta TaxID=42375 RepID=A0ACC1MGQ6_9PEZI|nr:hypothetical protein NUW58_g10718 [Xylaria curta]